MTRLNNSPSSIKQVWHYLFGSMRKNRRTIVRSASDKNRKNVTSSVASDPLASVNLLRDFIFDGYVTSFNSLKEQAPLPQQPEPEKITLNPARSEHQSSTADYFSPCVDTYCCSVG